MIKKASVVMRKCQIYSFMSKEKFSRVRLINTNFDR